MASNIEYDPYLLSEVLKVGGFKYKKDAVNAALKEYLQRQQIRNLPDEALLHQS
jgi:Arc/MetJ family transcription regulator